MLNKLLLGAELILLHRENKQMLQPTRKLPGMPFLQICKLIPKGKYLSKRDNKFVIIHFTFEKHTFPLHTQTQQSRALFTKDTHELLCPANSRRCWNFASQTWKILTWFTQVWKSLQKRNCFILQQNNDNIKAEQSSPKKLLIPKGKPNI